MGEAQATLERSSYTRKQCAVGVVHIGVGSFHRAHQAVYLDQVLAQGHTGWGIAGINLQPEGKPLLDALERRDGQYVLKTVAPDGAARHQEIRSLLSLHDWASQEQSALELFADGNVRMATITVTESGYHMDEKGDLDTLHPDVAGEMSDGRVRTIFGCLRAGLRRRMEAGGPPMTVMTCDNLRYNGAMLKRCFTQYLEACDERGLLDWLAGHVTFPNSMVDRITPRPTPDLAQQTEALFGIEGDSTVMAEDFIQWVIEDDFAGERPPLEDVGVQIVDDVVPFEEAKIRILNGGHLILAYFGALKGHPTYDKVLADPELGELFDSYQSEEVLPALPQPTPIDHAEYVEVVRARFANRHIADKLARLCQDGASKFPIFILPTVEGALEAGRTPRHAVRGIASWYVFMRHVAAGKVAFEYHEPKWAEMQKMLGAGREGDFAASAELWGDVPARHPAFAQALEAEISELASRFN